MALVLLAVEVAGSGLQVFDAAARKLAIGVLLEVGSDAEVDAAIGLVGVAVHNKLFDHLDLLDDMPGGGRFNRRRKRIVRLHHRPKSHGIALYDLHGLELFEARLFGDFVFAYIGIALEVTRVGNVAHVAHLVAKVLEVAKEQVET